MSEKTHKKNTFGIIIAIIIAAIIVAIIFLLNHNKTTITEKDSGLSDYQTLICAKHSQEPDTLLSTKNANSAKITIKAVFIDDKFSEISMSYYGEYGNKDELIKAENEIHSAYNQYTGKDLSRFTPAYNMVDNTLLANFYATASQEEFIREYNNLFLIKSEHNLSKLNIKDFAKNYEKQNFTCKNE